MERKDCEQVSPFKFNPNWLEYEEFHTFINNEWISYDVCIREIVGIQFATTLEKGKEAMVAWEIEKQKQMDNDLKEVEEEIVDMFEKNALGILREEET
jgi:hypothetical protein